MSAALTCEEDVMRIKRKLEKMMKSNDIDVNTSMDMLNSLKKFSIDLTILKNTGIGMVLNNLRKSCNSEDLGSLAKGLLKNWKKLVDGSSPTTNNSNENSSNGTIQKSSNSPTLNNNGLSNTNGNNKEISKSPENLKHNNNNNNGNSNNNNNKNTLNNNNNHHNNNNSSAINNSNNSNNKTIEKKYNPLARTISFTVTKDPLRLKCREMLANALELTEAIENGAELCDVQQLAARCEDVIFNEFKNTDVKYKNRIRSRVINLKDSKNPKLRESVRLGLIKPDDLATMTADQMASDELKDLRAKFTKESIDDHQMARNQGAKTSLLVCGKCKKNNVAYSEMQTRSADEPMTVFAFCQECGHRWKM